MCLNQGFVLPGFKTLNPKLNRVWKILPHYAQIRGLGGFELKSFYTEMGKNYALISWN